MRARAVVGVVLSVPFLGGCGDPVSPAPHGVSPRGPDRAAAPTHDVTATDLRSLGLTRQVVGVNERGAMVGSCLDRVRLFPTSYYIPPGDRAFVWTEAEGARDLGTLGGGTSCAAALNDRGDVVGYSQTVGGTMHAFLWTAEGGLRDLGTLPGGTRSRALDINEAGEIVGSGDDATGVEQAVRWTADGTIQSLGRLPDRVMTLELSKSQVVWRNSGGNVATAINDRGQAVGWAAGACVAAGPCQRAFTWTGATGIRDLTTPAQEQTISIQSYWPLDVNDGGTIVGWRSNNTGGDVTMVINPVGAANPLPDGFRGLLTAINDAGQAVGYNPLLNRTTSFFQDAVGSVSLPAPTTVPSPSRDYVEASALNNRGDVVGWVTGRAGPPIRWTVRVASAEALLVIRELGESLCLDVQGAGDAPGDPGQPATLYPCHGGANQRVTVTAAGELRLYGDRCLDVWGAQANDGDPVVLWPCHGGANQQWRRTAEGLVVGQNGKCLEVPGLNTAPGTPLVVWSCHGGANQKWDPRDPATPAGAGATLAAR